MQKRSPSKSQGRAEALKSCIFHPIPYVVIADGCGWLEGAWCRLPTSRITIFASISRYFALRLLRLLHECLQHELSRRNLAYPAHMGHETDKVSEESIFASIRFAAAMACP